jgi:Asp-tRNA(Asn)/Glu-tRNA(Gln) amidotransferase A subunit family amidase
LIGKNGIAMVKLWISASFFLIMMVNAHAQDTISKADVKIASKLLDVPLKDAEIDSLFQGLLRNVNTIKRMHQKPVDNSTPMSLWQMPVWPGAMTNHQPVACTAIVKMPSSVSLPANKNELAFYSIPQLASLIKNKKVTSVELTQLFLQRLKKFDDTLHCVISLTEDIALKQARRADSLLAKGKYLGMLHGIPYGLKDLFAVKGTKTTWGAEPYKEQVIDEDAYVYKRLRDAGAVLVAKLTLGALAQGDYWFGGRTRSPWNPERGSSGSSAGSASATVAGLVPFAIGTETWGSIISPSTACGATGLRPTFGSISRSGAMTLSWSLDKVGPICRSAEDAAIVFSYIRGADENDGIPAGKEFKFNGSTDIKQLKIGYAKNYFDRLDSSSHDWKVLEVFRKMGIEPQAMTFPDDSTTWPFDIMGMVIGAECAAAFDAFTRSDLDDKMTRQNRNDWPNSFRTWRFIPAVEYINANRHRTKLMRAVQKSMEAFDVIITPSYAGNQLAMTNLTGHPAIALPNGFNQRTGLPTSITMLANYWDEAVLLRVAKAYQDATDWDEMHPPLFADK